MNYAPAREARRCPCRDGEEPAEAAPRRACHPSECHHPLDCREAACEHLLRSQGIGETETAGLERDARMLQQSLADPGCQECRGNGALAVPVTLRVPEDLRHLMGEELTRECRVICQCLQRRPQAGTPGG